MLHAAAGSETVCSHNTAFADLLSTARTIPLSRHSVCRAELSASDRSGFIAALQGIRNAAALANASIPLPLVPQLANATVEYAARLTLVSDKCVSICSFASFLFHHTPSGLPKNLGITHTKLCTW